jgi:hypothetical protein
MGFARKVGVSNPLPLAESNTSRSQPATHCLFTPCASGWCSSGRNRVPFTLHPERRHFYDLPTICPHALKPQAYGPKPETTISDARTIDQETGPISVVMTIAFSLHPLLMKKGHRETIVPMFITVHARTSAKTTKIENGGLSTLRQSTCEPRNHHQSIPVGTITR